MELTPLEFDLIGDMAQDYHALHEVFAFVRLHHGRDPAIVRRVGWALVASWIERGWLAIAEELSPPATYRATDVGELLALIDAADLETPGWRGADTWLDLTEQAHRDVPWTAPAS